jgi:antitoxin ParD1/3/4
MPRTSRPITVTLGDLHDHVEARVKSGAYASASEVVRAAIRALDREEHAVDDWLRQRVDEAFADSRENVPAAEVFTRLRDRHAARMKTGGE